MSFRTLFKLLAALCVLAIMAFTGVLAYHIAVRPVGGIFERIIPNPATLVGGQPDAEFARMLDSAELPDIDPAEKVFQKAHELLALGKLPEAREKLATIINIYPTSSTAPVARRIVGEMNLDEILSTDHMEGKSTHVVKRGDSYLKIAGNAHTTLDCIMHLNGLMELGGLQPGDELIVMPLDFSLLIEPERKTVSIWDKGRFIREYPIVRLAVTGALSPGKTTIRSKSAELDGHSVLPQNRYYRAADKVIVLANPPLVIRGADETREPDARGIVLLPQDMEEIALLTRTGNEVEIR